MNNLTSTSNRQRICRSTLKARGWTDSAIIKYAPTPMFVKNPHHAKAAPMQLFYLDEIQAIEQTDSVKKIINDAEKRLQRAQKAQETKDRNDEIFYNKIFDALNFVDYDDINDLITSAIYSYFTYKNYLTYSEKDSVRCEIFLKTAENYKIERIVKNYFRHECSDYEILLEKYESKQCFHTIIYDYINEYYDEHYSNKVRMYLAKLDKS